MAYQKDNTDWISKEKRDFFFRAVISQLINDPKKPLEDAFNTAKTITDKAFAAYPDAVPEEEWNRRVESQRERNKADNKQGAIW